jgi:hypothetical protein
VYFINASLPKPHPIYHIRTNWIIHHPAQIKEALRNKGFEIVDNKSQLHDNIPDCGWSRLLSFRATGVQRGYLDVNGTEAQPSGDADIVHRVQEVLHAQYPYVEIVILVATLSYPALLVLFTSAHFAESNEERVPVEVPTRLEKMVSHNDLTRSSQRQYFWFPVSIARVVRTRTSPLLSLPTELQENIVSQLEFHEARRLRVTCRFYRSFITESLLAELRANHVERLNRLENEMKTAGQHASDKAICFTCLRVRPLNMFERRKSFVQCATDGQQRSCIPCKIKADGLRFYLDVWTEDGQMLRKCNYCQRLVPAQINHITYLCKICEYQRKLTQTWVGFLRLLQWLFGTIVFAVAFCGRGRSEV